MLALMLMYTISGIFLSLISIPLIYGKIGPNPWYGFRVPKTLSNPNVWYPANTYAAKRLFIVGIVDVFASIILYFIPNMSLDTYALSCGALIIGGLIVALVQSFLFLRRFP